MRERVEMVGGRMVVDSVPGVGTTVDVRMASQPATV
jgi:signal transduction histidine kinase